MGKVFSVEELTYGEFPKPGAHQSAATQIMEGIQQIGAELGIDSLSYMIHGSVGVGKENIRSDIDFIAVYPDQLALGGLLSMLQLLATVRKEFKVPIEYNLISDRQAVEGPHRIFPMFGEYLRKAQDETSHIVGRPADMVVVPNSDDFEADMLQYLGKKQDTFTQAVTNYNGLDIDWHRFGRAFDLDKTLSSKYRQLGNRGLVRIYTPTEEGRHLHSTGTRTAELAEEAMEVPSKDLIETYRHYVENRYLEALQTAARVCFKQVFEYRGALDARQKR